MCLSSLIDDLTCTITILATCMVVLNPHHACYQKRNSREDCRRRKGPRYPFLISYPVLVSESSEVIDKPSSSPSHRIWRLVTTVSLTHFETRRLPLSTGGSLLIIHTVTRLNIAYYANASLPPSLHRKTGIHFAQKLSYTGRPCIGWVLVLYTYQMSYPWQCRPTWSVESFPWWSSHPMSVYHSNYDTTGPILTWRTLVHICCPFFQRLAYFEKYGKLQDGVWSYQNHPIMHWPRVRVLRSGSVVRVSAWGSVTNL